MMGGNTLNTAMIGDTIIISGQNFSSIPSENYVSIHGVPSEVIEASNTAIKAKIPAGVPFSSVDLVVTRAGFQEAVSQIGIKETPSPVITSISPTSGSVGSVVTIFGKNLEETLGANMMEFAGSEGEPGVNIRSFNPLLATSDFIKIKVPAGAGTGTIKLYAKPNQNIENVFFSIVTPTFTVTP